MNRMTLSEENKVREITERLRRIASPVLRIQAILQYSQIVDILTLGDTSHERISELVKECDKLQDMISEDKEDGECSQLSESEEQEKLIS